MPKTLLPFRLLLERGGPPAKIRVGNGSELISRALDHWVYINRVTLDFGVGSTVWIVAAYFSAIFHISDIHPAAPALS